MARSCLDLAREYVKSGAAERDRSANLHRLWRKPTRYLLENLPRHLLEARRYREFQSLCLNPRFIFSLADAAPERSDLYRSLVRQLFGKRRLPPDVVARFGLIDRLYERLAAPAEDDVEQLASYIDERFAEDSRLRFSYLLILYTRRRLVDSRDRPQIREMLERALKSLEIDLQKESPVYDRTISPRWKSPERNHIQELVRTCFFVFLDIDPNWSRRLRPILGLSDSTLLVSLAKNPKPCNLTILVDLVKSTGPLRLRDLGSPAELGEYPLFVFQDQLKIINLYDSLGLLAEDDLVAIRDLAVSLIEEPERLTQDSFYWRHLSYQRSPIEVVRDTIHHEVFAKTAGREVRLFFLRLLEERFAQQTRYAFEFAACRAVEWSRVFGFEGAALRLHALPSFGRLWRIGKIWALMAAASCAAEPTSWRHFWIKCAEIPGGWKYALPGHFLSRLLQGREIRAEVKRKQRGFFNFAKPKEPFADLSSLANTYFRGDETALRRFLLTEGAPRRRNADDPRRAIQRACRRGALDLKLQKYLADLPYNINPPKNPPLLPRHFLHLLRRLRGSNPCGLMLFGLGLRRGISGYELTIPSRLFERFLFIPGDLLERARRDRPFLTFPLDLWRAWQLKRALAYFVECRSYRKDKDIARFMRGTEEQLGVIRALPNPALEPNPEAVTFCSSATQFFVERTPLIDGWECTELIRLQQEAACFWGLDLEDFDDLASGGQGPAMILIPPGGFRMGLRKDDGFYRSKHSLPLHWVVFAKPFALSRDLVTVGQFRRFVEATGYITHTEELKGEQFTKSRKGPSPNGELREDACWHNPLLDQDDLHPVVFVTREDAQGYADWLREETGRRYRLPSEAEWEYACRCGTDTPFFWGDRFALSQVNAVSTWGKERNKCRGRTTPVGTFPANLWGLRDMHGNVAEWVRDSWQGDYRGAPQDGSAQFNHGIGRFFGVTRGGSWVSSAEEVRSGQRMLTQLTTAQNSLGFRVARDFDV